MSKDLIPDTNETNMPSDLIVVEKNALTRAQRAMTLLIKDDETMKLADDEVKELKSDKKKLLDHFNDFCKDAHSKWKKGTATRDTRIKPIDDAIKKLNDGTASHVKEVEDERKRIEKEEEAERTRIAEEAEAQKQQELADMRTEMRESLKAAGDLEAQQKLIKEKLLHPDTPDAELPMLEDSLSEINTQIKDKQDEADRQLEATRAAQAAPAPVPEPTPASKPKPVTAPVQMREEVEVTVTDKMILVNAIANGILPLDLISGFSTAELKKAARARKAAGDETMPGCDNRFFKVPVRKA